MQKKKQNWKSKILLLASLLLMLQTLPIYSESGNPLPSDFEAKFGIDLTKNYTGKEVLALIDIVMQEAEAAITESYNAGYKQGVLAFKPEAEYWKAKAEGFETELHKAKMKYWLWGLGGVSIGFAGGMGVGIGINLRY